MSTTSGRETAEGPAEHAAEHRAEHAELAVAATDGVALRVRTLGEAANPPVLLLHGFPDSGQVWDGVARDLAADHFVIVPDVRGAGGSAAPETTAGYRMPQLLDDIDAVLDAAVGEGATAHLVGHDWGSIQLWSYVSDPARAPRARSFTSVSGFHLGLVRRFIRSARSPRGAFRVARQGAKSWYIGAFLAPGLAERMLPQADRVRRLMGVPKAGTKDERRLTERNGVEQYRQNFGRVAEPGQIDVPTQLVIAAKDRFVSPALLAELRSVTPQLWERRIQAGHWVVSSRAPQCAALIRDFVAARDGGPESRPLRRARVGYRPGREFDDHTVLVTGAGSGIGRETAFAFAERGAGLVLCDIDKPGLDRTADLARDLGRVDVDAHIVDVRDREAMERFAATVHAAHGPLDIVVNNAGVGLSGSALDTSLDDWEWVLDINLRGVIHGCHLFGNQMAESGAGGHIVNVASAAAFMPSATLPAYATSKAAVVALSENLRTDLGRHGVGVSAICPGIINTNITRSTRMVGAMDDDEVRDRAVALYAKRNYGPERVAAAIVDAVRRDRAVVPVSPEAAIGRTLHRLAPGVVRSFGAKDLPW